MRILFVSHYFPAQVGAPQNRMLETAQRLCSRGHAVTVLTGFPDCPDGVMPPVHSGRLFQRERMGEVQVIRAGGRPAPHRDLGRRATNRDLGRRMLNRASAFGSWVAASLAIRPEVIIAETPPLFTVAAVVPIARGLRTPVILNVAELRPESAVRLGALSNSGAMRAAEALERFAYRNAALIIVPSAGMWTELLARGEPEEKIVRLAHVEEHDSGTAFVEKLEGLALELVGDGAERARLRRTYGAYETSSRARRAWSAANLGNRRINRQVNERIRRVLDRSGTFPAEGRRLLDVGCGSGGLLEWLREQGAEPSGLLGVDVLPEAVSAARERVPGVRFELGDARELPFESASVDAVVLSTVFSSVLRPADRTRVAAEAVRVARPGGVILSYDLRYPSPRNKNVRPIGRRELARLFPGASITCESLTLLPPLARALGSATDAMYEPLSRIPPLRTHLLAAVRPPAAGQGAQ